MGTTSKNFQRAVDDDDVDAQWKSDSLTKKTHPTHQEDKDDSSTATAAAKTDIPVAKEGTLHVVRRGFILLVRGVKSTSPAVRCLPPSWRHSGAHTPKRGRTVIVRPFDGHTPDFGGFRVDFAAQRPFFPCSGDQCQLVVLKSSSSCSGWSLSRFSGAIGGRCAVKVGRILPFGSLMGYFGLLCAPATSTGCHVRVPALDSPCSILFSLGSLFWFSFAIPAKPTIARVGSRHGARGARIVREKLVIGSCARLLLEPPEPGADGRSRPTPSSRSGSRPSRQNHERIFSSTFFSFSFAQARGSRRRARRGGPRGKRNNSSPL